MNTKTEILEKIYKAYGTDSGILFGIKEKSVVEAIINFTVDYSTPIETLFIQSIDFATLKLQKQDLLTVIDQQAEEGIKDSLTGILHLIDSIQETAVDKCGMKEDKVFTTNESA